MQKNKRPNLPLFCLVQLQLENSLQIPPTPPLTKGGEGGIFMIRGWPNGHGKLVDQSFNESLARARKKKPRLGGTHKPYTVLAQGKQG
jgi:hypothetical protein